MAAWLAAREKPGLLVLASTFTSVPNLAAEIYPFLPVRWISNIAILYPEEYNSPMKYELSTTKIFDEWFQKLDRTTRNKLLARFDRIENGNFGDHRTIENNCLNCAASSTVVSGFITRFAITAWPYYCLVVTKAAKPKTLKKSE